MGFLMECRALRSFMRRFRNTTGRECRLVASQNFIQWQHVRSRRGVSVRAVRPRAMQQTSGEHTANEHQQPSELPALDWHVVLRHHDDIRVGLGVLVVLVAWGSLK